MSEKPMTDEQDEFAQMIAKTRKVLKAKPTMSVAEFAESWLFPLLDVLRDESEDVRASVEDIWDYIGEIPERPLLEEFEQLLLAMASFQDQVLVRAGWLTTTGPSDKFPLEMREPFVALSRKLSEVQAKVTQARAMMANVDDDDGDDDDADDEGDEATDTPASEPATESKKTTTES